MKKIIVTLIALFTASSLFGQGWMERRAEAYASAAQKVFQLDDEATAKIAALWMARQQGFQEVGERLRAGSFSPEETRAMNNEVAQKYRDQMIEVLGCSIAEWREFNNDPEAAARAAASRPVPQPAARQAAARTTPQPGVPPAMQRRAEAYAAAAQETFKINDEAKAKIAELWIARQQAFQQVGEKVRSGSYSQAEQREMRTQVAHEYRDKMIAILNCRPAQFREFNNRVQGGD